MTSAPLRTLRPASAGITVQLPDGSSMVSTHVADLPLDLPPDACIAHVFPSLSSASLISIGLLCDHGCDAHFTATNVTIT
jgi:hypothetical protein